MNKKEFETFREMLLEKRQSVLENIQQIEKNTLKKSPREASGDLSGYTYHMADMATDNYDTELSLNLASSEQRVLHEIDEALKRIEEGTYGDCLDCGKKISQQRLKAVPYTTYCITCQEKQEKKEKEKM
ncbi:MAG: TraR/DksA C4-type zinc finger protein [Candidatus Omnitrophica bacterium]|nr:TraR/DksA C4-type zinc finger protein [Candidatus Omnitrophota bacterium]